ncbi:glycoside hydrolase family 43 protein [Thalassotalea maritima]|uniref:glycoside hydrolase family 43 protein n=1 Tax=Thalassotalea maritima TaxID=3242416 RepID=UPI003526D019
MTTVHNPIIPGFNPDPSIIRVNDDYYIACSTFEWYPGVAIYHSKDLINWQLVTYPLTRLSQLDMRGNPDSCGVWAPCLSYDSGTFYLAFTDTKRFAGDVKDTPNFYVTTNDILGDWSDPIYVNSSGFDPSIFHDDDGKKYFINMLWDHRKVTGRNNWLPHKYFGGIMVQELDVATGKLVGDAKNVFAGSAIGLSEGPHIYKRDGYYYMVVAEGGTGKDHAVTFARAKSIWGPYQVDPQGPMLSSARSPLTELKRAGHGDLVETTSGEHFLVHLCSRPLAYRGRSVMGRETAIQPVEWSNDGWPRLKGGGHAPLSQFDIKNHKQSPARARQQRVEFDGSPLPLDFQTLRYPLPEEVMSQHERPGYLRLAGKQSLGSWFEQALIARRQQAFCYSVETQLDFKPKNFQQMAGLVCYYNAKKHYYLHVTHDPDKGRVLDLLMCCSDWQTLYPMDDVISLPAHGEIKLKAEVEYDLLWFSWAVDGEDWHKLPFPLDYSVLSDEVGEGGGDANFTGAFVGICCQDLSGQQHPAYFKYFDYQEKTLDI